MKRKYNPLKEAIIIIFAIATAPIWYRTNGGGEVDEPVWWLIYSMILISVIPLCIGNFFVKIYRIYKYSRVEESEAPAISFGQSFVIGWSLLIPVILLCYYWLPAKI